MTKLYPLLILIFFCYTETYSQQCITIVGDKTSGRYRQLLLDDRAPFSSDTTQPEMGVLAWTCNAQGYPTCNLRSLVRFDVTEVPANAIITSAKLFLYAKTNNINGYQGQPTYGSNNTALLQRATSYWTVAGTGWQNQPTVTTQNQQVLPTSTQPAQNYTVDMKSFVQYWVNNPDSNYGALLRLQTESYYNSMVFHSGQGPASLQPKLEICYELPTPPAPCPDIKEIKGNPFDGKFTQLFLNSNGATSADYTQPEMGAAAWTCNALGYPTCNFRSLFKYDVSDIPANAVVTSAQLFLYAKTNAINGYQGQPTYGTNNAAYLQRVTDNWTVTGTGWNNQPPVTAASQKILAQSTVPAQNYVVDMTDFVQYWVNKPDSNYGALLRLQTENYYNSLVFHSGQGPDSLKPTLVICYELPYADSCEAGFKDSTWSDNSLHRKFFALPQHNNNKKPVSICWDFGDGADTCITYAPGNFFNSYEVIHNYTHAGDYQVCVSITYEGGCVAEKCGTIQVIAPPPPVVCNNEKIIKGNTTGGKFIQLLLNSNGASSADYTQPEMGAAAWTCNVLGYPTCNFRSLFKYDVSEIPANAVITSAQLFLYAKTNNINGYNGQPTYGSNNAAYVQRVTNGWSTTGTGWANQPAVTTAGQKVLPKSTGTKQDYVVDMTDFVQYWVNKPDSNYGALLRLQTENYYNSLVFHSGQGPDSLKPTLVICYTIPATGTDSCKVNFTDSLYNNNPLHKRFRAIPGHSANKTPIRICWNFGDGTDTCYNYTAGSSTPFEITHPYATHGTYDVCVTIDYDGGCVAEKCKKITVFGAPPVGDCNNTITLKGATGNAGYRQLLLDDRAPVSADATQPEMGAIAWTCNAQGSPTCNLRSLFRYDVSAIPENAVITGAKLYLYAKTNNINGYSGQPTYGSNNTGLLQMATQPWTVAGTGWANQPATTSENQKTIPKSATTAQNYVIDVSDFVQYWVKHPGKNHGMLLRLQSEQFYNSLVFYSGQAPDSLQPRLEICYDVPATNEDITKIKVYPNPTTGPLLAWVFTTNVQEGDIKLYDLQGNQKQVLKTAVQFHAGVNVIPLQINSALLNRGVYMVKVRVGATHKVFRILLL